MAEKSATRICTVTALRPAPELQSGSGRCACFQTSPRLPPAVQLEPLRPGPCSRCRAGGQTRGQEPDGDPEARASVKAEAGGGYAQVSSQPCPGRGRGKGREAGVLERPSARHEPTGAEQRAGPHLPRPCPAWHAAPGSSWRGIRVAWARKRVLGKAASVLTLWARWQPWRAGMPEAGERKCHTPPAASSKV